MSHFTIDTFLATLPQMNPSLLAADFGNLANDIRRLEEVGAQILHLDIMDGHFVPNLSFGIPVVEAVRRLTDLPLDVHLMLAKPADYLQQFRKAGADFLTIHIEVAADPRPLFDTIRKLGAIPGLASNPPTSVEDVLPFVDDCDLILTMSVMPGFGGQSFNPVALDKLRRIRNVASSTTLISVDGGIGESTIVSCQQAGANLFVTGTALLGSSDLQKQFRHFESLIHDGLKKPVSPKTD
ncbi:MAG: ribulose-phosphate 3-epimerase [Thermoguttaceae bacterium]